MERLAEQASRHFWLTMVYQCDKCGHERTFYLEDGLEGPADEQVPPPELWVKLYGKTVRTVFKTSQGRYVLPVPFIACGCPVCQPSTPWHSRRGVLVHANWTTDKNVDTTTPPVDAPRFHYPDDWTVYHACGHPVLPWLGE